LSYSKLLHDARMLDMWLVADQYSYVKLLTDGHTNRQTVGETDAGWNITSMAAVINTWKSLLL